MIEPAKIAPRRPRPKYQVFISSTSEDLRDERAAVTWEILKARYIPAGMESFTAMDDRGWETITRTIDLSDYYVVIVAGRYGSIDPTTGISWTQREYWYARDKGMRVLAFIRNDAKIIKPKMDAEQGKLEAFKAELQHAHLCERWDDETDLRGRVVAAVRHQNEVDEDNRALPLGWYRGDEVPSNGAIEEFARLSAENLELRTRLEKFSDRKEELVVLSRGGPPEDFTVHATRIRVLEDPESGRPTYEFATRDESSVSARDVEQYAFDMQCTAWVSLRVSNRGSKPAKQVIADITATPAIDVFLHESDEPPSGDALDSLESGVPFYEDPSQHIYVDDSGTEDDQAGVRQRIKQIGAGSYEDLVRMGFRIAHRSEQGDENVPLTVEYKIASEDGVSVSGKFVVTLEIRGEVPLTRSEALGENS